MVVGLNTMRRESTTPDAPCGAPGVAAPPWQTQAGHRIALAFVCASSPPNFPGLFFQEAQSSAIIGRAGLSPCAHYADVQFYCNRLQSIASAKFSAPVCAPFGWAQNPPSGSISDFSRFLKSWRTAISYDFTIIFSFHRKPPQSLMIGAFAHDFIVMNMVWHTTATPYNMLSRLTFLLHGAIIYPASRRNHIFFMTRKKGA